MIARLQLGTSRFENLPDGALATFRGPTWINLGEPPRTEAPASSGLVRKLFSAVTRRRTPGDPSLYRSTNFLAYYYERGTHLPFRDEAFSFIFSEHFFEHLFMDDAFELFRECYRVLRTGGVMRTVVPDADLRTYEPPEAVGVGRDGRRKGLTVSWTHPTKHKSRWSVHNLPLLLRQVGFETVPLTFCDRNGEFHQRSAEDSSDSYTGCIDSDMIFRTDYVIRPLSLVVDGIKRERPSHP